MPGSGVTAGSGTAVAGSAAAPAGSAVAESGSVPAALMMGEKVIVPRLQATLPVAVTLPVSTTFPAPNWSNHTAGRLPQARTRQAQNVLAESRQRPSSLNARLRHCH